MQIVLPSFYDIVLERDVAVKITGRFKITRRQKKVETLIQKEVENIIRIDVSDPRVGFFTITFVKMSPDLKYAKISISFMGSEKERQKGFEGVQSARGYIQKKLSSRLKMKDTPILQFELDEGKEFRVEKILAELKKERENNEKSQQ
jgi:ribosome-binding factor A